MLLGRKAAPAARWSVGDYDWHRLLRDGYAATVLGIIALILTGRAGPSGIDGMAYWLSDLDRLYTTGSGTYNAFLYSPAVAQAIAPLTALPWSVFLALLTAMNLTALYWLLGPWAFPMLLVPTVSIELLMANINLLLAAAIVAGFRYPWTWSLVLLTKITPGVGLLWFLVRREWRSLAIAIGATAAIAAVSFVVAPTLWFEWFGFLIGNVGRPVIGDIGPVDIPLLIRLPIAAALVIVGALTNRPQTVPIAAAIGQPVIWGYAIAVGALPLIDWRALRRSAWRFR